MWHDATHDMLNEVYGEKFHLYGENKKCSDSKYSRPCPTQTSCQDANEVISQAERVIASNVFEEKDFPSMVSGRVALLGDGQCARIL